MASQEAAPEAGQEKAPPGVRSVLLKRDSPGAEDHLQRRQRRHRAQQVRFKDLEEGGEEPLGGSHLPHASAANRARQSWPQSGAPLLLSLPDPHGAMGISTASQTSPSLQRPLRSKSSCDLTQEGAPCAVGRSLHPPLGGTTSLPAALPHAQQCPRLPATLCPELPPPRGSCPPYLGQGGTCLLASFSSQHKPCAPSSTQPPGLPSSCSSSGTPWLFPPPLCQPPSEQASRAPPCAPQRGTPSPSPLAQGPPTEGHTPAFLLPAEGHPQSGKPPAPAASSESLSTTQAHPTAPTPSQKPPGPSLPSSSRSCPPETCLPTRAGETLPCVQDHLLQLVSVAPGLLCPTAGERAPPPASQDFPGQVGDLHSQLHSLEGVLETSQRTIQVLLDVIQDLEKKEAQRDGRQSYRTGQDTTHCGTCRDCACIIYSVEHDFRKQEGRLQQVLSTIEPELSSSPPVAMRAAVTPSHQEPSPTLNLSVVKAEPKKSRRRCFWFL